MSHILLCVVATGVHNSEKRKRNEAIECNLLCQPKRSVYDLLDSLINHDLIFFYASDALRCGSRAVKVA